MHVAAFEYAHVSRPYDTAENTCRPESIIFILVFMLMLLLRMVYFSRKQFSLCLFFLLIMFRIVLRPLLLFPCICIPDLVNRCPFHLPHIVS